MNYIIEMRAQVVVSTSAEEGQMGLIEVLVLRSIWQTIKPELMGLVDKSLSGIISKFKAILATSVNDLSRVADDFLRANPEILMRTDKDTIGDELDLEALRLVTVPLFVFQDSQVVNAKVVEMVRANRELQAAKNKLNISSEVWERLSKKFSQLLLQYALRYALERAAKANKQLGGSFILAIENEAYSVDERGAQYYDVVKLLYPSSRELLAANMASIRGDSRSLRRYLRRARKKWRSRHSLGYDPGRFSTSVLKNLRPITNGEGDRG